MVKCYLYSLQLVSKCSRWDVCHHLFQWQWYNQGNTVQSHLQEQLPLFLFFFLTIFVAISWMNCQFQFRDKLMPNRFSWNTTILSGEGFVQFWTTSSISISIQIFAIISCVPLPVMDTPSVSVSISLLTQTVPWWCASPFGFYRVKQQTISIFQHIEVQPQCCLCTSLSLMLLLCIHTLFSSL